MGREWTERDIEWYERAVRWTGFGDALALELNEALNDCVSICDMGCGTGFLSVALGRLNPRLRITAIDQNESAMAYVAEKTKAEKMTQILPLCTEWETLGNRHWDAVVLCAAGQPEQLPEYLEHCDRRLIIVSREPGAGHVGAKRKAGREDRKARWTKAIQNVKIYNAYKKIALEFGQPFRSQSEAKDYLVRYGAEPENLSAVLQGLERTDDPEYPLYLPYQKQLGIYVLDKTKAAQHSKG